MSRLAFIASALLFFLVPGLAQLPSSAQPRVRLVVAVADADAYERTMALVADGRLTALDGEAFVVVGDFADARQGYSFGRALQRRLQLPFELIYEPDHPQADLAWTRQPALASRTQLEPQPPAQLPPEPLVYLYAVPQSALQRQRLAQLLPEQMPSSALPRIRVGVFRRTPSGQRLLAAQQRRLDKLAVPYEQLQLEENSLIQPVASSLPTTPDQTFDPGRL
jgi:hypothetical protein